MCNTRIKWIENNGSFLAYQDNKYCGMVSQTPNDSRLMNPGEWSATWHSNGGIESCGYYPSREEAKARLEKQFDTEAVEVLGEFSYHYFEINQKLQGD